MKWLFAFIVSLSLPAFACEQECNCEVDWAKVEADRKQFLRGRASSDLDGRIVCVGGNVFEVTGFDPESGMYHAIGSMGEVVDGFTRDNYKIPITRDVDENNLSKYDCGMTEEETKAKARSDAQRAEERAIVEKQQDAENAAYEAERKRRCEVEPQNYPEDCSHVWDPPKEKQDEHSESSAEDAGTSEQESRPESGPSNHKE